MNKPPRPWVAAVALGLFALLTLAQLLQAWHTMRVDAVQLRGLRSAAAGSLCSVLLVSGVIYYGTLDEADGGFVKLSNVYYVRSGTQANGVAGGNELMSRRKVDWHGPEWMLIPLEKIVFVEKVGAKSQVATLIAADQARENAAH